VGRANPAANSRPGGPRRPPRHITLPGLSNRQLVGKAPLLPAGDRPADQGGPRSGGGVRGQLRGAGGRVFLNHTKAERIPLLVAAVVAACRLEGRWASPLQPLLLQLLVERLLEHDRTAQGIGPEE